MSDIIPRFSTADDSIESVFKEISRIIPPKAAPKLILNTLVFNSNKLWVVLELEKKIGGLPVRPGSNKVLADFFGHVIRCSKDGTACVTIVTRGGEIVASSWNGAWSGPNQSAGWHVFDLQEVYDFRAHSDILCNVLMDGLLCRLRLTPKARKRLPPNPEQLTRPLPLP